MRRMASGHREKTSQGRTVTLSTGEPARASFRRAGEGDQGGTRGQHLPQCAAWLSEGPGQAGSWDFLLEPPVNGVYKGPAVPHPGVPHPASDWPPSGPGEWSLVGSLSLTEDLGPLTSFPTVLPWSKAWLLSGPQTRTLTTT